MWGKIIDSRGREKWSEYEQIKDFDVLYSSSLTTPPDAEPARVQVDAEKPESKEHVTSINSRAIGKSTEAKAMPQLQERAKNYSMFSHKDYRKRYSEGVPATMIRANGREAVRSPGKIEEDVKAGLDKYVKPSERHNYRTEQDRSNDSVDLYCKEKRALTAKSESITVYKHWANSSKNQRDDEKKALIILKSLRIPPSFPKEGIYVDKEDSPLGKAVHDQYKILKDAHTAEHGEENQVEIHTRFGKGKCSRYRF